MSVWSVVTLFGFSVWLFLLAVVFFKTLFLECGKVVQALMTSYFTKRREQWDDLEARVLRLDAKIGSRAGSIFN